MAVYTWIPDQIYVEEQRFPSTTVDYESGKETRLKDPMQRRDFTLQYEYASQTTKEAIAAFYEARSGGAEPFYWDSPFNGETYLVNFSDDAFQVVAKDYGFWNIEVHLQQQLGNG